MKSEKPQKQEEAEIPEQLKEACKVLTACNEFLSDFELVFHFDWENTEDCIKKGLVDSGTFLEPGLTKEEESNNWSNRGALLASYRNLKAALGKQLPTPADL